MMHDMKVPIINYIEQMVNDIPGWSPVDQLYSLFLLAYSNADINGNIIEIGSWCGRSSTVLALAAKMTGVKRVLCIDLFPNRENWMCNVDGSYSFKVKIGNKEYAANKDQTIWKDAFEQSIAPIYAKNNNLFDMFTENVKKSGYSDCISTIRGSSSDLKSNVDSSFKCKFAFIDGDHGYDMVSADIKNIERYLVPGAWVCFDDAFSTFTGVNEAIEELIINNANYVDTQQLTRKLFVARWKDAKSRNY